MLRYPKSPFGKYTLTEDYPKSPFGTVGEAAGDPLDDYFAVVSLGFYPNPDNTPTATERAYFAVSYGLLGSL